MTEKNEIQVANSKSPNQLIQMAIEGNADLEKLEKLLGLQERYDANEAKKVYASDFAVVQSDIEAVVKTKINPQTRSNYAGLENVIDMAKPAYTKRGFSIIFYEGETAVAEHIRVCADVLHKDGHKETYHYDVPLGGVGIKGNVNMTKIHAKATSVTYGRRYLLCMIWNIPTADDDGNAAGEKGPIEFPKPKEEEMQTIAEICALLNPAPGFMVNPVLVAKVFYAERKEYPPDDCDRAKAATFIWSLKRDIFVKDSRSEFEKNNDLPGDEDSQPDGPQEFRYVCNDCSEEFDTPKANKLCPKCLTDKITDRRPE